jgi:hypothetical protein
MPSEPVVSPQKAPFEKYLPVVTLYDKRQAPAHGPLSLELLSERAWRESAAWPGKRSGLRLMELSSEAWQNEDMLPGQMPFKPRCLMLDYDLIFRDAGAEKWIRPPSEAQAVELEKSRAGYEATVAELEKLKAEKEADGKTLEDEQNRQLAGAREMILQLQDDAGGYARTFNDLFECNADGLKYGLSVPNIPVAFISKETLGQDPAVTLRILREQPVEGQDARHDLIFKFSNGKTQYALVFRRESSVEWWHYKNMSGSRRAALEAQLAAVEDTGRLTGADNEAIAQWRGEIDAVKETARLDGRTGKNLTDEEKLQIAALKENIRVRKDAKSGGLSGENERKKADLENKIFYDKQPVNLQEDTKSFYNRIFDVTIMFHRKGFVSLRMDKNPPFFWENKAISKLRGFNQMLPKDSRILIEANGGAWGVCVGRPRFKKLGQLWTQDIAPGFTISGDEARWLFDCEFIATEIDESGKFTGIGTYGQKVVAKCVQIVEEKSAADNRASGQSSGGVEKPARYQLQIEMTPDESGVYSPEVYFINFHVLAGEVAPRSETRWSSLPSGNRFYRHRGEDVQTSEEIAGGMVINASIHDPRGDNAVPLDIAGRECDLKLIRMSDGTEYSLLETGVAKRVERHTQNAITLLGGLLGLRQKMSSKISLTALGLDEVLNQPIGYVIYGNTKYPNDFLRELCRNAGLRPSEYSGIPAGNIGIKKLKPPAAGEPPDILPARQARFWEYMQHVVRKYCYGWRLAARAEGLVLEPDVFRDKTAFHYQTTLPASDPFAVRALHHYQDLEEFFTSATFTGAKNPQTGKRWSATKTIPEATDKEFEGISLFYVGTPRPYVAETDDGLASFEDCALAVRRFMRHYGLPPWYFEWDCAYNGELRPGDILKLNDVLVLAENVRRASINIASGTAPTMSVTARVYADIPIGVATV